MCLALYKFMLPVLVTFFAIEQLGSGYSVHRWNPNCRPGSNVSWVLHTLQSFVIILTFFFHTEQITWQLDGVQYSDMFTFEMIVASHHMISKPKRYNYRNPPGLFMYSLPHAQRTPKISSIKNCALLLLYSLYRHFPKDIFQKYLRKMVGVCYI